MPVSRNRQRRSRSGAWVVASRGNVFYRTEPSSRSTASTDQFPTPHIGPRRVRPHAIHIITYPSGYVPRELRADAKERGSSQRSRRPKSSRRHFDSATEWFAHYNSSGNTSESCTNRRYSSFDQNPPQPQNKRSQHHSHKRSESAQLLRPVLGKLFSSFSGRSLSTLEGPRQTDSAVGSIGALTGVLTPPAYDDVVDQTLPHQRSGPPRSNTNMSLTASMATPQTAYHLGGHRNSLMSVRSAKSAVSSLVTEVPKPVASGSGVSCSILLAERNIFLSGFEHDANASREGQGGTALLRGKLQLNVTKNVKIKAVQLKLLGRARTEWPEGIPPLKTEVFEEESLRTQVLTFFNAMNDGWETEYGNQCTYKLKTSSANSSSTNLANLPKSTTNSSLLPTASQRSGLTAKELKRLSLQSTQSRSFGKSENGVVTTTQAKGFKVFYPGTYDYTFELPIDHHQLESCRLQYGSVKWELHATVDRAGAFKPNLHGMKEVSIVRLPDQMSLETTEPISISRQWEDQLHYDIVISGKSFPIGSKIPIAFKLTPLAKVQVHKIKVYVTESIEYWTNDRRVTRKDPGRKILLLEKAAGKPLDSNWSSSQLTTVRGGELTPEQRRQARETANRRRAREAVRLGRAPEPLPEASHNLLGDLDLGLESMWGSTEIEANVQLPTCDVMAKNKELRLNPDCSWKNVNVYHWIKIVLRLSRLDPEDPSGTKRRHFEISIDSPFTVLNCRATQANTNLPAYADPMTQPAPFQSACGCRDSATIATDTSPNSSTGNLTFDNASNDALPMPPQAAHLSDFHANPASSDSGSPTRQSADGLGPHGEARPIHLLRVPSFNPPAFDDDTAPPPAPVLVENPEAANAPLMTPPPHYDVVIGTPSVDGLADYFTRLADYGYEGNDEEDDDSASDSDEQPARILDRNGRVNVAHPRTPGGRMPSRSFELSRPPVNLSLENLPTRPGRPAASGTVG